MSVSLKELEFELKQVLRPEQFKDYCPNGLQVQGRGEIARLVTGVTACQELIEAAVDSGADALLVHHGYFWRGEDQSISGIKKARIQSLLKHDINLFAYHLPLDVHKEFGNNVQLANVLGIEIEGELGKLNNHPIGLTGTPNQELDFNSLQALIADKLGRKPLAIAGKPASIKSIAWCTGAAQNYIELAVAAGVDAYITGEVSEPTVHIARESGIHFFSAGHHATERYGVQAVGGYLAEKFGLDHQFIDIDNPV
ncbi:MAG: Nif3-like dinuclear metal center hexameric protein [Pseudohongiellaceae bacterium]